MFTDLRMAVSLLTVVPTGTRWPDEPRPGVAGWFSFVGLLLGSLPWVVAHSIDDAALGAFAVMIWATLLVIFFALATRMLHLDGLADVADAWWGGHTPQRRLVIMSDSATGAFGATAITLTAVLQVAAISQILITHHQLPILVVPAFARLAAMFAAWLGTPARSGGLGFSVIGRPRIWHLLPAIASVVGLSLIVTLAWDGPGIAFAFLAIVLALVVPHLLSSRMGGVTGDVMGASILIVETILYVVAALGSGLM